MDSKVFRLGLLTLFLSACGDLPSQPTRPDLVDGPIPVALYDLVPGPSTLTFNTSDDPFDEGVDNQGVWKQCFWVEGEDGDDGYELFFDSGCMTRPFFSFKLSALTGNLTARAATLEIQRYGACETNQESEPVSFFDVSTPAAQLNENSGHNSTIFDDLGSGTPYGTFNISEGGDPADLLSFPLNQAAVSDINAAAGGWFSVGARLDAPWPINCLFKDSDGAGIQRLVVEVYATVDIDIKPGEDGGCVQPKSKGRTSIAILGTADFDVTQIDPVTVSAEGPFPIRWALEDVNLDGMEDLMLQFSTPELEDAGVLAEGRSLTLTGKLVDGIDFEGYATVYLAGGPNCN